MNIYNEKYLKYKKKYLELKNYLSTKMIKSGGVIKNDELNIQLNNFFNIVEQNDLYNQIYNKFYYLPLKNNIQIVLKYYPYYACDDGKDYCMIKFKNNYNFNYDVKEQDNFNNEYYYRPSTHLHDMLKDEYIEYITVDNIKVEKKNIIPKLEWKDYIICPTIDPVHRNHLLLINKNETRAHQFYFPTDSVNLLKDMVEYNRLTGNYIYNSIELGSIPEIVHFHTSNEIPPLDNITEINKLNKPIYTTEYIKIYKINFNCYDSYYFEISNDFIDIFINILPQVLYDSRYVNEYKYMSQVFICPFKYNFYRIVITFRRVNKSLTIPIDGKYSEEYYSQLFGPKYDLCYGKYIGYKDTLRFNVLGYEPIIINYEPYEKSINDIIVENDKNKYDIINSCFESTSNYLKEHCKKIYTFNESFEKNIIEKINKINVDFKTKEYIIDNYICERVIYNTDFDFKLIDYNDKYIKSPEENLVVHNNKHYQVIKFNNNTEMLNHIKISTTLYKLSKLFSTKIYDIGKNKVYYKHIVSNLNTFLEEKKSKYGEESKNNFMNVFFMILLYNIYVTYKNGYIYEDINEKNIFITNDLAKKDYLLIELQFKLDKKLIINFSNGKYNFYGFKPIILNSNLIKNSNLDNFIESVKQLYSIFKLTISNEFKYPDIIYNFINDSNNEYNTSNGITFNITDIIETHNLIINKNNLNYENTFRFLYEKVLEKSESLLSVLNLYSTIIIPKNTHFASATSFNILDFDNSKRKYMLENNWNYRYRNPNWFVSNYNLDSFIHTDDYKSVNFKELNGANSDFYIKDDPIKFSRHLIFRTNKDIKLLVTEFNGIKRLEFQKKLMSIIYDDIFDKIPVLDSEGNFNHNLNEEFKKYNILSPDSYVTFIMDVLCENNLLDIDGYIGMDWIDKHYDCVNSSSTIEYLLLNSTYMELIGLYYYDYYENNFKLFYSQKEWNKFFIDRIKKINASKISCKDKNCDIDLKCKQNTIYDYSYISKQYIKNLNLIMNDNYILNKNIIDDFEDSQYNHITFSL
jgi:hypothetical protein